MSSYSCQPFEPGSEDPLVAAGPLFGDVAVAELALYFASPPGEEWSKALGDLLSEEHDEVGLVDDLDEVVSQGRTRPVVGTVLYQDPATSYAAPDQDYLQLAGHGLSAEDHDWLQSPDSVLVLQFGCPREVVWPCYRRAVRLVHGLATRLGGLIWDANSQEMFRPEIWRERRIEDDSGRVPDLVAYTIVRALYAPGELTDAESFGLSSFGLPDFRVRSFARSDARQVMNLVNLIAQRVAEGQHVGPGGRFELVLADVEHPGVRQRALDSLKEGASGRALLKLREVAPDDEIHNRLIEIGFDAAEGESLGERQAALLARLFGGEDSVTLVDHDHPEVRAASEAARAELGRLQEALARGLSPGERILVKAPFTADDGTVEWMWVEVVAWRDGAIQGLLMNDPHFVDDLELGSSVEVLEEDVFDYMFHRADGGEEGNETAAVLRRLSAEDP